MMTRKRSRARPVAKTVTVEAAPIAMLVRQRATVEQRIDDAYRRGVQYGADVERDNAAVMHGISADRAVLGDFIRAVGDPDIPPDAALTFVKPSKPGSFVLVFPIADLRAVAAVIRKRFPEMIAPAEVALGRLQTIEFANP